MSNDDVIKGKQVTTHDENSSILRTLLNFFGFSKKKSFRTGSTVVAVATVVPLGAVVEEAEVVVTAGA